MPKVVIEIDGQDEEQIMDLLDDVVVLIHNGCPGEQGVYDGCRVRFVVERDEPLLA